MDIQESGDIFHQTRSIYRRIADTQRDIQPSDGRTDIETEKQHELKTHRETYNLQTDADRHRDRKTARSKITVADEIRLTYNLQTDAHRHRDRKTVRTKDIQPTDRRTQT